MDGIRCSILANVTGSSASQVADQKAYPGVARARVRNEEDIIGKNFDSSTCNGAVQDRRAYCCNIIAYAIAKRSHEDPSKTESTAFQTAAQNARQNGEQLSSGWINREGC